MTVGHILVHLHILLDYDIIFSSAVFQRKIVKVLSSLDLVSLLLVAA